MQFFSSIPFPHLKASGLLQSNLDTEICIINRTMYDRDKELYGPMQKEAEFGRGQRKRRTYGGRPSLRKRKSQTVTGSEK